MTNANELKCIKFPDKDVATFFYEKNVHCLDFGCKNYEKCKKYVMEIKKE